MCKVCGVEFFIQLYSCKIKSFSNSWPGVAQWTNTASTMLQDYGTGLTREPGNPTRGYLCQLLSHYRSEEQWEPNSFPLLHKIIFKSQMYLISSPLPFKVPRKHKQESAKNLWVTDADWLENIPEVVPESWKFDPRFTCIPQPPAHTFHLTGQRWAQHFFIPQMV